VFSVYHNLRETFRPIEPLFYIRIPCLNLGIKSDNNKQIFQTENSRVEPKLLNIDWSFNFLVKLLVEARGFEGTWFRECGLLGFEGTVSSFSLSSVTLSVTLLIRSLLITRSLMQNTPHSQAVGVSVSRSGHSGIRSNSKQAIYLLGSIYYSLNNFLNSWD